MTLLSRLLVITRRSRYKPEIIWSSNSWVHNIFRVYELIFWRRVGIRAESSYNSDGRVELYTFEAWCAFIETCIRRALKFKPVKIYQLRLASNPYGYTIPMVSFAIAHDADALSAAGTTSPFTWSHTVTGSNPLLSIGVGLVQNTPTQPTTTAVTYNSVSATKARGDQKAASSKNYESSIWFLGSASTGANTVSVTATLAGTSPGRGAVSVSYTGAQSGNTADAVNGLTGITAAAQSFNVTTVADNCWVVATGVNGGTAGTTTLAATQTDRGTVAPTSTVIMRSEDTNAVKTPAGAQAMGFTTGATAEDGFAMSGASFAPAAAASSLTVSVSDTATTSESLATPAIVYGVDVEPNSVYNNLIGIQIV